MTVFPIPVTALGASAAALLFFAASAVRADDLQEATRLLRAGQHAQALERVNRTLASKPRDPQARFLKGIILAEQGSQKEALEIFLRLTQDYPQLPEPYNNLAVLYAAQGQYDKARVALEQSIRTHPSYATAYENLGDVYAKLASQAYDKALQLDSSNVGTKQKLALVRELVGTPGKPGAAATKPPAAPAPPEVEAKPAPAARVAAAAPAADGRTSARTAEAEVLETVHAWARAWSAKDADAYLAFYAQEFAPPGGEPRAAWEKTRRQRIAAPKTIEVSVGAPKVAFLGEERASVTFRQTYRSDLLSTTSTKTLVLVKADGRWRIEQERVNP